MLASLLVLAAALIGIWAYENGSFSASISSVQNLLSGSSGLNATQISQYASNAGFSGQDLVTAIAIALAESGGNPNAYNPETQAGTPNNMGSYGLWQIYLNAHPEFSGVNLYDPQTNANAAYNLYQISGFSPWSTFKSGSYLSQLTAAQEGVANG